MKAVVGQLITSKRARALRVLSSPERLRIIAPISKRADAKRLFNLIDMRRRPV